jgi:hypothetical protein
MTKRSESSPPGGSASEFASRVAPRRSGAVGFLHAVTMAGDGPALEPTDELFRNCDFARTQPIARTEAALPRLVLSPALLESQPGARGLIVDLSSRGVSVGGTAAREDLTAYRGRPEMAPQRLEKIESAPENGRGSEASKPQHLVHGFAASGRAPTRQDGRSAVCATDDGERARKFSGLQSFENSRNADIFALFPPAKRESEPRRSVNSAPAPPTMTQGAKIFLPAKP